MNRSDLKTGMRVEYRNGERRLVLRDTPVGDLVVVGSKEIDGSNVHNNLAIGYTDDLLCPGDYSLDIVTVYDPRYVFRMFDIAGASRLIWRRKEPKKMTLKQIEKTLGYEVEIVEG